MSQTITPSQPAPARSSRMPRGIPFIVGNEAAERFCFYGMRAILVVYMTQYLAPAFSDARATESLHLFQAGVYFFPMMGALLSDLLLGKYRTIISFSLIYALGTVVLAAVPGERGLFWGLFLIALGSGGIKPCVSANVGDQFTTENKHLIERAFSYFYLSVNAGSMISTVATPWLLKAYGPRVAFGVPAVLMLAATLIFWLGRSRYVIVPPALGKNRRPDSPDIVAELTDSRNLKTLGGLCLIYLMVAVFWALYDQTASTWVLQARSDLMDKTLFPGLSLDESQLQVINPIFILTLTPLFSFFVYPFMGRFFTVTPLRKIGIGLALTAGAFLISGLIEGWLKAGQTTTVWWQVLAYFVITAAEVMVSITSLEFSYKQAPPSLKSIVMGLYLLAVSLGNVLAAGVNHAVVLDYPVASVASGATTTVTAGPGAMPLEVGRKLSFDGDTGLTMTRADGQRAPFQGTFLVASDTAGRIVLMDPVSRRPVTTEGTWKTTAESTVTRLDGPVYFYFFAGLMFAAFLVFLVIAVFYREADHIRHSPKDAVAEPETGVGVG